MKPYCTQNNGDCSTCSLVNYGLDCQNNPVGKGGAGRGQGRKPSGRYRISIWGTDGEEKALRKRLEELRAGQPGKEE